MKKIVFLIILVVFPLVVIALPVGDVDCDGKVGSSDYILVRKHLLELSPLEGTKLKNADVNNDGSITSADYIYIRKIIIDGGKTVSVPTATPVVTQAPTATPVPATPTPPPATPTPTPYVITDDKNIDARMQSLFGNVTEVASCSSSTLNYRVLKFKDSYYNTEQYFAFVWVKDPVNQLNAALASYTSGNVLASSNSILQNEKNKFFNDKDGCMIAVNGSFFTQKSGSYTEGGYKAIVINRGKVIYDGTKSNSSYGKLTLRNNGKLEFLWHNTVQEYIDDGVINTWDISHFRTVKYEDDKYYYMGDNGWINAPKPCNTEKGYCLKRTIIAQDMNNGENGNFVLISGDGPCDILMGYAYQLTNGKMNKFYNLDGSGSRRLYAHKPGESASSKILNNGDGRNIADLLYFSEHIPNK